MNTLTRTSIERAFLRSAFIPIVLVVGCFALSPMAQAVSPAPDGGYPGGNTAEGQSALFSLTSGIYNTAVGIFSLESNAAGNFNTAIGAGALFATTSDENTATGAGALFSNSTGEANTAQGVFALFNNTDGSNNTANGLEALFTNRTGQGNTATGAQALFFNNGDPTNNEASYNSAFGDYALFGNTTGYGNSAFGSGALDLNNSGSFNTAAGFLALGGSFALGDGTIATGNHNTALGAVSLSSTTEGFQNTAVGAGALANNTIGSFNIALGSPTGGNVTTASNVICIGHPGLNVDNSCFIGHIRDALVAPDAIPVLIDSAGKLGTTSGSSRRFKKEIKPMDRASESILRLKPVSFHYKNDSKRTTQFGLIAEEVAEVNADVVVRDDNGDICTVRYDAVNAMLLNEFLKEHKKVGELEATVAEQQKSFQSKLAEQERQIKALAAGLQKVSAEVEISRPTLQMVVNKPQR